MANPGDRHVKRKYKVEMKWNCSSCSTKNLGRDTVCVSCGNPKEHAEKSEAYQMPTNLRAAEVKDPELLQKFNAGANWPCENCGSDQRRADGSCLQCSAPAKEPLNPEQTYPEDHPAPPVPTMAPRRPAFVPPSPPPDEPYGGGYDGGGNNGGGGRWFPIVGIGLAIVAVFAFIVFLFWPRDVIAKVESIHWERSAELFQRQVNSGEGWWKQAPSGSYSQSCTKKQNGTENCNPHDCNCKMVHNTCYDQCDETTQEDCNPHDCSCKTDCVEDGAGGADCTETCATCYDQCPSTRKVDCNPHDCNPHQVCDTCYDQCPVIEDWCTYQYDTWPSISKKHTSGSSHEEAWPELTADSSGNQRLSRTETYTVSFTDSEDHWSYTANSLSDFQRFNSGEFWNATVSIGGGISPVAPAQPASE